MEFSRTELRDLVVAWLALGLAFTFFFARVQPSNLASVVTSPVFAALFVASLLTVGIAFLLHELAHKVVAVRFGQIAEFRADYGMLFLAVAGGLAGFIFAAPGAVHHRGRITERKHGLIALAGPITNLALAVVFLATIPLLGGLGERGVSINLLLAGFNMLPIGGLDGSTVRKWSLPVYLAVAIPSILLGAYALLFVGV